MSPAAEDATPALDADAVLWARREEARGEGSRLLVLLHGYGADEHDLFAFARELPSEYAIAAVRAPLTPPWPAPGASWYPIEGLQTRDAARITQGATRLWEWIDEHAADAATIGLFGFSQGASIAIQALRLRPERVAFAVALSGFAAPGALPGDAALAERRPPVFWGRGQLDDVIPEALIVHSTDWLPAHVELSGRTYPGLGHGVSQDELDDIVAFLRKRLLDEPA